MPRGDGARSHGSGRRTFQLCLQRDLVLVANVDVVATRDSVLVETIAVTADDE
jgi:hypothetical protein